MVEIRGGGITQIDLFDGSVTFYAMNSRCMTYYTMYITNVASVFDELSLMTLFCAAVLH